MTIFFDKKQKCSDLREQGIFRSGPIEAHFPEQSILRLLWSDFFALDHPDTF